MGSIIIGVDPGPTFSAYVVLEDGRIASGIQQDNGDFEEKLRNNSRFAGTLAIEQVRSYGRPVGEDVFATVYWSGRFVGTWLYLGLHRNAVRIPWPEIARHFCHATHGVKESHVRRALIDRFGPEPRTAIGLKASPGPLYGLTGHMWSAAAVALMAYDQEGDVVRNARKEIEP